MNHDQIAAAAAPMMNTAAPLQGLLDRGASFERVVSTHSSSVNIGGIEASTSQTHFIRHEWTLPGAPTVQGSFVKESFKHKLVKVFKKELQVGDAAFDDLVYISTDTPDITSAYLACPGVRDAIASVVGGGGSIVVDGSTVRYEVMDEIDPDIEPDPQLEAAVLAHLLATVG